MSEVAYHIRFFLVFFVLTSCASSSNLYNTGQIRIGQSFQSICRLFIDVYISSDPCYGEKRFFSDKKLLLVYPNNRSMYFIFSEANNSGTSGKLILMTRSFEEASFFINSLN